MSDLLKNLEWRYATKVFDRSRKISTEDMDKLLQGLALTSSSFGLQPWKFVVVENKELREKLKTYSWNQSQITDASHLLVFTRINDNYGALVDRYLDKMAEIRWTDREKLKWYEESMKWFAAAKGNEWMKKWADEQVFIALGNALSLCADLKIDSCAIWGFDSEKYDKILWLKDKGLSSVVILPIWYRDQDADKYATLPKVRFDKEDLVIKY